MKRLKVRSVFLLMCLIISICSLPVLGANSIQDVFYVSPNGNDQNPGTKEHPFRTIEKAREIVREINDNMHGDIVVYLRGGVYEIDNTIEFTEEDSGTNGYRVIYQAYSNETPIISGGTQVTDWEHHEGNIYKAQLERDTKLRALYVNGQRVVMAKRNIVAQGGFGNHRITKNQADWAWISGSNYDGVRYNMDDLPQLENPEDLEITTSSTWNLNLVTVRDQITAGNFQVLLLQQPYGAAAQSFGWGTEFKVLGEQVLHNAYEFLDEPGEFYFNTKTNTLYYYKYEDEDLTTAIVIAPKVEGLLSIKGSSLKSRVENISFIGITFAYSDWNLLEIDGSRGQATLQGPTAVTVYAGNWHFDVYRAFDVPGAAIEVESSKAIVFERNTIEHTGNIGLSMTNDVTNSQIIGNKITDTAGSAIVIGHPQHVYEGDCLKIKHPQGVGIEKEKYPPEVEGVPRNIEISNNYIYETAVLFHGQNPITAFFVEDLRITHNVIKDTPYGPISVGWGWWNFNGDRDSIIPGIPTKTAGRNRISYNRLINYGLKLTDTGAIYTLGYMPDTTIDGNYVVGASQYMLNAIHPDEGTAGVSGKNNVFNISDMNNFELNDWGRKNNIYFDNTYTTSTRVTLGAPNVSVTNLHVYRDAIWPHEALEIIEKSGLQVEYQDLLPLEEVIFIAYGKVSGGTEIEINVPKDFCGSIWFAPFKTTNFELGSTMTKADIKVSVISAPMEKGFYKLYVLVEHDNLIMESKGTLWVNEEVH